MGSPWVALRKNTGYIDLLPKPVMKVAPKTRAITPALLRSIKPILITKSMEGTKNLPVNLRVLGRKSPAMMPPVAARAMAITATLSPQGLALPQLLK